MISAWPPPADHRIPPRAGEAHMPPQMYAQPQYYQPHPGMPYNMYHQPPMQGPGLPQMHMAIPYMQQPQPPPPQKRPTPQADGEESGTKTKKARTSKKSATDGNGGSRSPPSSRDPSEFRAAHYRQRFQERVQCEKAQRGRSDRGTERCVCSLEMADGHPRSLWWVCSPTDAQCVVYSHGG